MLEVLNQVCSLSFSRSDPGCLFSPFLYSFLLLPCLQSWHFKGSWQRDCIVSHLVMRTFLCNLMILQPYDSWVGIWKCHHGILDSIFPGVQGVIVAGDEVGWLKILPQLPGALLTERIIAWSWVHCDITSIWSMFQNCSKSTGLELESIIFQLAWCTSFWDNMSFRRLGGLMSQVGSNGWESFQLLMDGRSNWSVNTKPDSCLCMSEVFFF